MKLNVEDGTQNPLSNEEMSRYTRQMLLGEIGLAGQARLKAAKVLVIGAGGIGSSLLMYLAGMGVGLIGVVDGDVVEASNLHRQVIHNSERISMAKAESAKQFIQSLNPNVKVTVHNTRLEATNSKDLFLDYDVILDGCDNAKTRYLANDTCVFLKVLSSETADFRRGGEVGRTGDRLRTQGRSVLQMSVSGVPEAKSGAQLSKRRCCRHGAWNRWSGDGSAVFETASQNGQFVGPENADYEPFGRHFPSCKASAKTEKVC